MGKNPLLTVAFPTVAIVLALTPQGCASADPVPAAGAPPSQSQSSGATPACRNDDVAAEITLQPDRADGVQRGLVALRNASDAPCRVEGHASISLRNAADEVVEVPTDEVDEPGPAAPITLKPGTNAFAGIKWTPCDKADPTCGAGNTLSFNLQASTDGPPAKLLDFPAPEKSAITMKSLKVGTLQPATQGVVAW